MIGKDRKSRGLKPILTNFDLLAEQKQEEKTHKSYPDIQIVRKLAQSDLVKDENGQSYSLWCDLDEFRRFGPGVFLSFYFLKYILILMGFLSIFPVASMIILILENDHFKGTNMEIALESTTLSSLHQSQDIIVWFNFVVIFVLTVGIIAWKNIETKEVIKCTQIVCLSSYFTVLLTQIPNYYSEKDLQIYLQKNYGKVHQIYTPKNYHQDLIHFKQCLITINQFKDQRRLYHRSKHTSSCLPMVEKFLAYKQKHEYISQTIVQNMNYQPYCAFVTFRNVLARNKVMEDQENWGYNCWTINKPTQKSIENTKLYKGQRLLFKECKMEPDGIVWVNLNLSSKQKLVRCSIIAILLAIFLFISILIFGIMAAAEASLYKNQYGHLSYHDIVQTNNADIIQAFCIELSLSNFYRYPQCQPYKYTFIAYTILYISFPLIIIFLKMIFSALINKLVILRKHRYEVHRIHWKIIIITLFYILTSAVIKWFLYQSFHFGDFHFQLLTIFMPILNEIAKFIPIRPDLIHLYHDFTKQWAAHASHKIILIGIFVFNFVIVFHHFSHLIHHKCNKRNADHQTTQKKMQSKLQGDSFSIEYLYSQTLTVFLFCMVYFSCMPIIFPLAFLSLLLLYWTIKYKFVRLDKKPPVYAHSSNQLSVKIFCVGLLINALVSPLYFGNLAGDNDSSWFERYLTYWYYTLIFIVLILFLFCRSPISRFFYFISQKIKKCQNKNHQCQQYTNQLLSITAIKTDLQSYSMHNNRQYAQLLRVHYLINHKQLHHLGYYKHSQINELKSSIPQSYHNFTLFTQIYEALSRQLQEIQINPLLQSIIDSDLQKCKKYFDIMNKIKEEIIHELKQECVINDLDISVKNKMKDLSKLRKISKLNHKKKSQKQQEDYEINYQILNNVATTGNRCSQTY